MSVSIGPRIKVDGEEQYRQQLNSIIQQSKTLDAELRAMTAAFDENATAEEKARITTYNLNDQLDLARKRTELVREMTMKSAEATEENSSETLKWRQALAAAEEQQAKLEHAVAANTAALEGNDKALANDGEQMVSLGSAADQVAGKLGIKLPEGAKKALDGMNGLSAGSVAAMAAVAAGVAVAVKAVQALYDMVAESARKVDDLNTRAAKTGLDAGLLQGLDYAQRFLDFDNLDGTLQKLTVNMGKARDGAEKQTAAFERLDVSVFNTDGTLRNNYETFLDVIDALGGVYNETERDTLANDLFGKSYAEMKPLVDAGTGALRDYMQKAEDLGLVLDEAQREKLQRLSDTMEDNDARWTALKDRVSLEFAPAFADVLDIVNDGITTLTAFSDWLDETGLKITDFSWGGFGAAAEIVSNLDLMADALTRVGDAFAGIDRDAGSWGGTDVNVEGFSHLSGKFEISDETVAKIEAATETIRANLNALAEEYQKAYDAAYQSLDGQFSLWEEAKEVAAASTEDMLSGLQSQLDYWTEYAANFEDLMSRNLAGIEDFAQNFTDGSKESAAALAGLKDASDEEIAAIIAKMAETDEAKRSMAERFAALETDLDGNMTDIRDKFAETIGDLETVSGGVDFSAFEAAVDDAFSGMEARAEEAVAHVQRLLAELSSSTAAASAPALRLGYNAVGTDDWRGGWTRVGEGGPETVWLPQHTRIVPAQNGAQLPAGDQNITINVQGIQQLDEVVRWYDSRRVRERMK